MSLSVFICNNPKKLRSVYGGDVIDRLSAVTQLDTTVYSKQDVLASPQHFEDTEYIFSTWGMPVFSLEEIQSTFPSLKALFYAAGTVQAFARPFLAAGCRVFSAWAANAVPVAEYTVAQVILANKGYFTHAHLMSRGQADVSRKLNSIYRGSYGCRVGLIGCGMIGSMVAERLKAFELDVAAFDPFLSQKRAETLGVTLCGLDEIFSTCCTVSNHLANNPQTRHILNYSHFSSLPPYATFINTGRGAQVVEDDLVRALTERPDLTALLDVTYPEPPSEGHPFYTLENCFLTPHIAGSLGDEVRRMSEYMYGEFCALTEGSPLQYQVTESMLDTMA